MFRVRDGGVLLRPVLGGDLGMRCNCGIPVREVFTADQCRVCWKYKYDPAFRAMLDSLPDKVTIGPGEPPAPDCVYLGRELTGFEINAAGLDNRRRWSLCAHSDLPLGLHVCGCVGCGPSCAGYVADEITSSSSQ